MKTAEIIVEIKAKEIDRVFYYSVPEGLENELQAGMRVSVPFGRGNRLTEGYVTDISDDVKCSRELKEIIEIKDKYAVISPKRIELAKWMREKYYCTLTECLQCIMPKVTTHIHIRYADLCDEFLKNGDFKRLGKRQEDVIGFLRKKGRTEVSVLKDMLGISSAVLNGLEKRGIIEISEKEVSRDIYDCTKKETADFKPTEEQQKVIDTVIEDFGNRNKAPFLLRGVTGSGKTLVYMEIVDRVVKAGKQAVVLVPEISLTPQTVQRFINRFGSLVSVTHSKMSAGERFDQWEKARRGDISVMIGPRSAIFAPFDNLGAVIIDEEHEKTYKSDSTPKYDAREIAVKLQELYGCEVIFGSATPAIESYYKGETGEYRLLELKNRVNRSFPDIFAVDMRDEISLGNKSMFSLKLQRAIRETLDEKKQIILFLNRRGHSTFISCRKCGYVMKCERCSVNLTYHKYENRLFCHYCGEERAIPEVCPGCGSEYIKFFGVGTEKIEEEVNRLFPNAKVLRMDMDTTKGKDSHRQILNAFAAGEADILVGTQMIAKGLDFPNVTLVGVVAADLSLNSSDYRAAENTFQLITQVAGRAGRAGSRGRVLIQTYMPENYCIEYAKSNNYIGFYKEEIEFRRQMRYPPFSHICVVLFTGEDEKRVISSLHYLGSILDFYGRKKDYEKIGPAAAMVSKINERYRHRIIIKGVNEKKLKNYVFYCLDILKEKIDLRGISINVSIDPGYIP